MPLSVCLTVASDITVDCWRCRLLQGVGLQFPDATDNPACGTGQSGVLIG